MRRAGRRRVSAPVQRTDVRDEEQGRGSRATTSKPHKEDPPFQRRGENPPRLLPHKLALWGAPSGAPQQHLINRLK